MPTPTDDTRATPSEPAGFQRELAGFQRKALRGLANPLKPVVHVGEGGVSEGVLRAVDEALLTHELIKIRLHEPPDKKEMAAALAEASGAALCGLVGHTVILYRPHPESPRIELPTRPKS